VQIYFSRYAGVSEKPVGEVVGNLLSHTRVDANQVTKLPDYLLQDISEIWYCQLSIRSPPFVQP
jgi:hypothetical protein